MRAEILKEREKADNIKSQIQEEIKLARQNGEEQKAQFAQEVLAAREKSQESIRKPERQKLVPFRMPVPKPPPKLKKSIYP